MTDYTPPTDIIRIDWVSYRTAGSTMSRTEAEAQFNRWLAEHDRQIAEAAYNEGARTGWMNGSGTLADVYKHNPYEKETNA